MNVMKWLPLKSEEIAPSSAAVDAEWVQESPSPYDIPTHLGSFYDAQTGLFVIQFKYLSSEDVYKKKVGPYFHVQVGRKSKRIYELDFDIHSFNRDKSKIAKETLCAIEKFDGVQPLNKTIALRALSSKEGKVFEAIK